MSFYFQNELFSNLAILFAAISLIASMIFDKRAFNSNLFLFLSMLPIYLIIPLYQNPMLATLLITLLISVLVYKKQVFEIFNFGKIKDIRIWLAIVVVSLVASISLIVWGISTSELTGVGEAIFQELERLSVIVILVLIPIGALLNATVEEFIFRGIIQTELSRVFSAVDLRKILSKFGRSTKTQDPIVHFYEDFLFEYDFKLRKVNGVWYAP